VDGQTNRARLSHRALGRWVCGASGGRRIVAVPPGHPLSLFFCSDPCDGRTKECGHVSTAFRIENDRRYFRDAWRVRFHCAGVLGIANGATTVCRRDDCGRGVARPSLRQLLAGRGLYPRRQSNMTGKVQTLGVRSRTDFCPFPRLRSCCAGACAHRGGRLPIPWDRRHRSRLCSEALGLSLPHSAASAVGIARGFDLARNRPGPSFSYDARSLLYANPNNPSIQMHGVHAALRFHNCYCISAALPMRAGLKAPTVDDWVDRYAVSPVGQRFAKRANSHSTFRGFFWQGLGKGNTASVLHIGRLLRCNGSWSRMGALPCSPWRGKAIRPLGRGPITMAAAMILTKSFSFANFGLFASLPRSGAGFRVTSLALSRSHSARVLIARSRSFSSALIDKGCPAGPAVRDDSNG